MGSGRTVALFGIVLLLFGDFLQSTQDPVRAIFSASGMVVLLGLLFGIGGVWLALAQEVPAEKDG